jgi:mRNA interferase MazF
MSTAPTPKRGEIWLVEFDPSIGAEIHKRRPAVVVSADDVGLLPLRIVVPLTDWKDRYASLSWFTMIAAAPTNGLTKKSAADAFQIKSLSVNRFVRPLGMVTEEQLTGIVDSIAICVGSP